MTVQWTVFYRMRGSEGLVCGLCLREDGEDAVGWGSGGGNAMGRDGLGLEAAGDSTLPTKFCYGWYVCSVLQGLECHKLA